MNQEKPEKGQKNQALSFILAQLIATIVLSAPILIIDETVAYSAFVGGLIATLANTWFAVKVFRIKANETAETLLATFYVGEIYKFIFTGAMFVMAFVLIRPVSAVALLVTYFLIHMTPAVVNVFAKDIEHSTREK